MSQVVACQVKGAKANELFMKLSRGAVLEFDEVGFEVTGDVDEGCLEVVDAGDTIVFMDDLSIEGINRMLEFIKDENTALS